MVAAVARFLLLTRIHVDTFLLTNVGAIWPRPGVDGGLTRIGEGTVSEVTCIAPVITPFRMAIVASTYNGALNISLNYRTCLVSQEKARAFLDLYVSELLSGGTAGETETGTLIAAGG